MGCKVSHPSDNNDPHDIDLGYGGTTLENVSEQKPKALIRDIEKIYKAYVERKEQIKPFIFERTGLQSLLEKEREKLMTALAQKEQMKLERDELLKLTWEKDADDIHRAFNFGSLDKGLLISIIMNRSKWQLQLIAEIFELKYGRSLLEFVINEMTTVLGTLATGSNTGLSKLLTYRIMTQPERDAAFLRDCSDAVITGLVDDIIIEIVTTRTNAELSAALEKFEEEYNKPLSVVVKSKSSYKNYRDFMLKMLECEHDEAYKPLAEESAKLAAKELYDAGKGRLVGIDAEVFIRILGNINHVQFDSINKYYKDNCLLKDIQSKCGGSFEQAIVARVSDKYEYLAKRLDKAMRGFTVDKETLCRILGSLKRHECVKVSTAYDRLDFGRSLEKALSSTLTKGNFQKALLDLVTPDAMSNPLGTDREVDDEEREATLEGERAKTLAEQQYKQNKVIALGEQIIKSKQRTTLYAKPTPTSTNTNTNTNSNTIPKNPNIVNKDNDIIHEEDIDISASALYTTTDQQVEQPRDNIDPMTRMMEELNDDIPVYYWDTVRGRFFDVTRLIQEFKDCNAAAKDISLLRERIADEIIALREIYFSITKSCIETEVWNRILRNQLQHLKKFLEKKEIAANSNGKSKKR